MHVGQLKDLECPACVPGERAVHGDGNQKLSTWDRGRQASREPYYKDVLFAPAQLVDQDMKAVDKILKNERADTHCGGHWAAASNSKQRRDKQEVTGRYFLTDARHGGPVAALNQIRTGERYSYALTLALAAAAQQVGLRQLHIDIMCKWAVWLQRLNSHIQQLRSTGQHSADAAVLSLSDRLAQLSSSGKDICSTRLVHSAAHGSLHAQSCQVLYQPSAVDGCGKTSGEAGEQLFSGLSPLGRTTCQQSVAGSTDVITEHCVEIGRSKRAGQADFLVGKLKKYKELQPPAIANLQQQLSTLTQHNPEQRPAFVLRMRDALKAHATAEMKGSAPHKEVLELFSLARSRLDAPLLDSFLNSGSQPRAPAAAGEAPVEVARMVASIASGAGLASPDQCAQPY